MHVHLRKKKLQDGRESLYLDIYKDGKRSYEFLKLYIKRGSPENKEILSLAEKIKAKRLIELANDEYDQISSNKRRSSFIKYFEKFSDTKPKWSNYYGALKHLKIYLEKTKKGNDVIFKQINKVWLSDFSDWLSKESGLSKNTCFIYFRKVKEVLYKAAQNGYIKSEMIRQARGPVRGRTEREYLTLQEIQRLMDAPIYNEKKRPIIQPDIRNAFLFSALPD